MASLVFETERLAIRLYETEDAPFVLDMYSRWEVQRYLGASPKTLQSLAEAHATIERYRAFSQPNPLLGVWAVTLRSGQLVGTVLLKLAPLSSDLRPMPLSEEHEVGWHLHPDHWGHGYATEAADGALRRARSAGIQKVVALVMQGNEPSRLVAERIGMKYIGLTDRYYSIEAHLYEMQVQDRLRRVCDSGATAK